MNDIAALIGVWHLASYSSRIDDGPLLEPLGSRPVGIVIYTSEGFVSAQLARSGRPHFGAGNPVTGPTANPHTGFEAFAGYLAYCGRYVVDSATKTVEHHVQFSLSPNWEHSVLQRGYELDGDSLTLRPPPRKVAGGVEAHTLRWRRELRQLQR